MTGTLTAHPLTPPRPLGLSDRSGRSGRVGWCVLAALGLLPMALSHDIGSETQRPLAIVIIGGLITATLLTLVVLPALYVAWFSNDKKPVEDDALVVPSTAV